jgi:polyketide synthase 12
MDGPLLDLGRPRGERADAARNRVHLLDTARVLAAELGAANVTMDGLAARSGLGKGTVFRRFGSRAGIFRALLSDEEVKLQEAVLAGPPPLGPGAAPLDRLLAYGAARIGFLFEHSEIARAALDGGQPVPAGSETPLSRVHIRMLLEHLRPEVADLGVLAAQLTSALDGPLLLLVPKDQFENAPAEEMRGRLVQGWTDLVNRLFRP